MIGYKVHLNHDWLEQLEWFRLTNVCCCAVTGLWSLALTEGGVELLENKGNKAITVLAECHIILGIGSTLQLKVSEGEHQLKRCNWLL